MQSTPASINQAEPALAHQVPNPVPPWRETLALAALVALAAWLLRLIGMPRLGITHFDEGQYVFEALGFARALGDGLARHSPQHAPPLFAAVMGLAMRALGPYDCIALATSAAFGAATVGLIFAGLDRLAGRAAAWVGALLLAVNPLHLTYSRMALTDGPSTFFYALGLVLALARLGWHPGLREPGAGAPSAWRLWVNGAELGVVTGLAMLTKYQGFIIWMSAAFFEVAWLALALAERSRIGARPRAWRWGARLGSLALAAALAWAIWLPWRHWVDARFGPEVMHAQHKMFVIPWSDQPLGALKNWAIYGVVGARWSKVTLLLGLAGAWVLAQRRAGWAWIVAGWILAYLAALGLYVSFVRLVSPIVPALTLLAAAGFQVLWQKRAGRHRRRAVLAALLAIALIEGGAALRWRSDGFRLIGERLSAARPDLARVEPPPPLVTRLSHPIRIYQDYWNHGMMLEPGAPLHRYGRSFYVLTDYSVDWVPNARELFRAWAPYRVPVAEFPNPRLEPSAFTPLKWADWRPLLGMGDLAPDQTQFILYEVTLP